MGKKFQVEAEQKLGYEHELVLQIIRREYEAKVEIKHVAYKETHYHRKIIIILWRA